MGIVAIFESSLGLQIETILLLMFNILFILPYAKDFKLGIILHTFVNGLLFTWFYNWSITTDPTINWSPSLLLFMMFFITMCFTLYNVQRVSPQGLT